MTGRWGRRDDGARGAERDPALEPLLTAARDTSGEVDTVTLERTLAAYRVAGENPVAEPPAVEVVTRRHRVVRALAATTIATKVLLGLGTAVAVGGIGVAVTETVHHSPRPAPTSTVAPASTPPSGRDGSPSSPPPAPTTGAPSTVSDSVSPAPTTSPPGTDTKSTPASPTSSRSASPSRSTSPSPSPSRTRSSTAGAAATTASPDGTGQGR